MVARNWLGEEKLRHLSPKEKPILTHNELALQIDDPADISGHCHLLASVQYVNEEFIAVTRAGMGVF